MPSKSSLIPVQLSDHEDQIRHKVFTFSSLNLLPYCYIYNIFLVIIFLKSKQSLRLLIIIFILGVIIMSLNSLRDLSKYIRRPDIFLVCVNVRNNPRQDHGLQFAAVISWLVENPDGTDSKFTNMVSATIS